MVEINLQLVWLQLAHLVGKGILQMSSLYSLYGLKVRTHFEIPYLTALARGEADLDVIKGKNADFMQFPFRKTLIKDWFYCKPLINGSIYLRFKNVSEFIISPKNKLVKWYSKYLPISESFQSHVLNQVLSFALLEKKVEALHGTAVIFNKKALLFMGESGYGKSTLASAFMSLKGCPLLTDDLVVFKNMSQSKGYNIYPGLARVKLFPNAAKTFLKKENLLKNSKLVRGSAKRIFLLKEAQYVQKPAPLKTVYLLPSVEVQQKSKKIEIKTLNSHQALMGLHANLFNRAILTPEKLKREFLFCEKILKGKIQVKAISYPRGLKHLEAVCNAICAEEE